MGDIGDLVCAFCGSLMGLNREMPASALTHAMRFFSCDTCGASELRIDRGSVGSAQGSASIKRDS